MNNESCVICGKPIKTSETFVQAATIFTAHGNFGSTLWDPVPRDDLTPYLQITICDKCLTLASQAGRVLLVRPKPPIHQDPEVKVWRGDEFR